MNKIIRNKLTKEVQDLYTENCKTLLKDILKDLNNWKNCLCLWFARLNIVKTAFFFFWHSGNPLLSTWAVCQPDLQIEYNPHQNPRWFLYGN